MVTGTKREEPPLFVFGQVEPFADALGDMLGQEQTLELGRHLNHASSPSSKEELTGSGRISGGPFRTTTALEEARHASPPAVTLGFWLPGRSFGLSIRLGISRVCSKRATPSKSEGFAESQR